MIKMVKILFLDYRQLEIIDGFKRALHPPKKHSEAPLLTSEHDWGDSGMSMYGSVIYRQDEKRFQTWYTTRMPKKGGVVAYAESEDGINWERPKLDISRYGRRKTNIVFDKHPHGTAVYYDEKEERPGWKYKMLTGAAPSGRISAFRSADGINWKPAAENPVIGTNPDCPMSFCRLEDGRYVAFHRPGFADRRVGRTESWDFRNFSEPAVVMEPDQCDPPNTQFYGLGATTYGEYMIGSLWIYNTDVDDMGFNKMYGFQQPEFVHSRGSYCWHRTDQGTPLLKVELGTDKFDRGQIQPASSPVFMEDEVRFYYVGSRGRHGGGKPKSGRQPVRSEKSKGFGQGLGMASCKPDRFVGVTAKGNGRILTRPFWTDNPRFCINANVRRNGGISVGILDIDGNPIDGFEREKCRPVKGDSTCHVLSWKGEPDQSGLAHRELRLDIRCRNATIYSIYAGSEEQTKDYRNFRIPTFLNMEAEKERM